MAPVLYVLGIWLSYFLYVWLSGMPIDNEIITLFVGVSAGIMLSDILIKCGLLNVCSEKPNKSSDSHNVSNCASNTNEDINIQINRALGNWLIDYANMEIQEALEDGDLAEHIQQMAKMIQYIKDGNNTQTCHKQIMTAIYELAGFEVENNSATCWSVRNIGGRHKPLLKNADDCACQNA